MGRMKIQSRDGEVQWLGEDHQPGLTPRQRAADATGFPEGWFDKFGNILPGYEANYNKWLNSQVKKGER